MQDSFGKHPPLRALLLSLAALAIPIAGRLWISEAFEDYEALLWLTAVVPAFLLAYYRGWRGAATALAGTMALVSVVYATTQALGKPVPQLLPGILVSIIAISLGAGFLAERLQRRGTGLAPLGGFTDLSTGLPNRSHAELHLEIEFGAAQRGRALAVVLFHIDEFKAFTARHGSQAGEEIVQVVGEALKRTTRRMNLTARFAQDEFLCILGGCDDDGALLFVNRFLEGMRGVVGQGSAPSISGGIASFTASMHTHHDLIAAAQNALKQARREGRGRMRVHGRSMNLPLAIGEQLAEGIPAPEITAPNEPAPDTSVTSPRLGRGRKALVVVEEAAVRDSLTQFFVDEAFSVAEASNVVDGVQYLSSEYDLLCTDISLTEGLGAELVRAAKLRWPSIQVLGLVQQLDGNVLIDTLNAGVDRFDVVPLELPRVRRHVAELLARRERITTSLLESRQLSLDFQARTQAAVAALKQSEEEHHAIVSSLHEVVFRTDLRGAFVFLSEAWAAATGYSVGDCLGRSIADFVHDEDCAELTGTVNAIMAGDRRDARGELRMLTKSGEVRWFEWRIRRNYDNDSHVIGLTGTLDDVTLRKQADDALRRSETASRALLAALPDEVYRINGQGMLVAHEGQQQPAAHLVGGSIDQVFPSAVASALRERVERVLRTGGVELYDYRALAGDQLQDYEVKLAPGAENEVVAIVRNVTERISLEEQLRQSQKLEAIGRLAGGLAHDFNNLLTVVQGNAQLLADETLPESAQDSIQQIHEAADHGTALVQQLLAFGRRQILQPTILNLNTVIESTRTMLVRLIGEHIVLSCELDPQLGLVKADPGQIEQVLVNVAINARDAMPTQGGQLKISTRNAVLAPHGAAHDRGDAAVVLSISDDGAGMDAETRQRVFEPFFTTKASAQAAGLGLATVYGIVRQSGGTISVTSEPGRGTTFEISLPRIDG